MLQSRIMSYADAHRYRLGTNYDLIPVNQPKGLQAKGLDANTPYRDGSMRVDDNNGSRINYDNTSRDYPSIDPNAKEAASPVEGMAGRIELDENDYFDQAKMYFEMLSADEKDRLAHNIAGSLGKCAEEIQSRQMELFRQVNEQLVSQVKQKMAAEEPLKPNPKPATV